ncbi:hypothetical protein [Methylovirgula sp. HY1]|uniref:hypothetical protein n=1 Tax=Methylovirgula sp. HY1 TaxID=2822761 RepID=UPI001C5ACF86|nr:hypothetical protein [Methylovirgula sp. HY1]
MAIFSALRFISKKRDAWLIFVEFLVARGLIGSICWSMSLSGVTRLRANHLRQAGAVAPIIRGWVGVGLVLPVVAGSGVNFGP